MVKRRKKGSKMSGDDKRAFAFIATFLSILGVFIVLLSKKKDKYILFYAKQSLVVFVAFLIAAAAAIVPFVGWLASPILQVAAFILWIFSWINALTGDMKETPLIGHYGNNIKF